MTYGNRNPRPAPEADEPFKTVRVEEKKSLYGVTIHWFTVAFAAADFEEPNVRGVVETISDLADAVEKVGFTLQARELREAAREFSNERNE